MEPVVKTSTGALKGATSEGIVVFRGIPFAKPPTGALRFRPPQPLERWDGVRDATAFGPTSLQVPNELLDSFFGRPKPQPMDEDCLYLNVWTPKPDGARRPVMVWIHGGGFTIGAGSQPFYDGTALASRDAVVVTINYRLGALGFLRVESVSGGGDEALTNFGMLDQIAALEWVRDEIAAFGGDPENVTIFGESAGGMSVGCLMASPLARGLFHKAILQSGAAHTALTLQQAEQNASEFLQTLGAGRGDAETLRSFPASEIIAAQASLEAADRERTGAGEYLGLRYQPVIDGLFLESMPIDAITGGNAKDVAVLIGTNCDEWKLFAAASPNMRQMGEESAVRRLSRLCGDDSERARAMLETYREARGGRGELTEPYELFSAAMTDWMFRIPADRLAEAQSRRQEKVFAYRFDWPSPLGEGLLGACHALDIPFVFGTHHLGRMLLGSGPKADGLAKTMGDAWVALARNGDPSTKGLSWPPFDPTRRRTMILDGERRVEELPREQERCCWEGLIPRSVVA
jgi:para-nitrobenzyl esterase